VKAPDDRVLATRAARVLNDFMGHLHAARSCQIIWIKAHEDSKHQATAKYGLQVAFGTIALTMRKFEDFSAYDLPRLIRDRKKRPDAAKWLVKESKTRHLGAAASTLIAHYANRKRQIPSTSEVQKLIERSGWATEEEVMEWVGPVIEKVEAVRNAIMAHHNVTGLTDPE
jgi:hypothetical protein